MKKGSFQADWKKGGKSINMNVPVMVFEEDGIYIAYIPVLDLSGYAANENEAIESLKIVIDEYLNYTVIKNTFIADLKALGWTVSSKKKPFVAPDITEMINRNDYLHDIFNTKEYRMKRMPVLLPQL